jgi:excisionase family DNA binding protein
MGTPSTGQRIHRPEPVEPLVVKPKIAERLLNVSHNRLYQLISAGDLESFRDGSSRKITMNSIKAYIARHLDAGG